MPSGGNACAKRKRLGSLARSGAAAGVKRSPLSGERMRYKAEEDGLEEAAGGVAGTPVDSGALDARGARAAFSGGTGVV
ncbi:hypothetical protein cyc_02024 [Cyclospora cayetanensis]|uniref:Uncharacterized protein n=1 Tax=Cyclospora cayetanensis TaxID=88456 RepID=A0A1D3CWA7_9EIME|nr:hypothetical protein cyc_02024 [Cyclospora cayetanensis]